MPTIPPARPSLSMPEPHQARHIAESFGSDAGRYDRARPTYPDALVERIVAASPGPDILDVGIGTGIVARLFQAADGMREVGAFRDPEQWRFEWERTYTRDEWLDQVPTTSDHSQFPSEQLVELLVGIGAAIDALGGSFTMRYTTLVITARVRPHG
jgi:hypothetical protein